MSLSTQHRGPIGRCEPDGHYRELVGFSPHHRTKHSRQTGTADYVLIAAALVCCAALVLWALLG